MGSGINSYLRRRRAVASSSKSGRAEVVLGAAVRASIETLENRTLLSGSADGTAALLASIVGTDVNAAGGNTTTVTVRYQDSAGVDPNSIDPSDLVVTAPDGSGLAVQNVSVDATDLTSVVANYVVASAANWSSASNGQYSIALPAGSVTDSAGNPVAAAGGSFNVSISAPDTAPPVVQIAAADINSAGCRRTPSPLTSPTTRGWTSGASRATASP